MAPRCPNSSTGSDFDMAPAANRMQLKVPMRLISMTFLKPSRSWGVPSRAMVRDTIAMPAQFTSERSGAASVATSTAVCT